MVLSSRRINVRDVLLRQQADCGGSKRRWFLRRGWRGIGGRGWIGGVSMPRGAQGTTAAAAATTATAATVAEEESTATAPVRPPSFPYAPGQHPHPRAHHLRARRCRAPEAQPLSSSSDQAQGRGLLIFFFF